MNIPRMFVMVVGMIIAYVPATVPCDLGTHIECACIPRMCAMVAGTTMAYVQHWRSERMIKPRGRF